MLASSEAVAQRRRLDYPLVGKLFMGGRDDGQARRSLIPARHARSLGCELWGELFFSLGRAVAFG